MLLANVLIQESINQLLFCRRAEIAVDSFILLLKTFVGLVEIGSTGCISNELITFESEVVGRFSEQDTLELLLVELTRVFAHFNEHLNGRTNLSPFDNFAVSFCLDFLHQKSDQSLLDLWIQNDMMLKLAVLHVFNEWKVELGHIVLVHVEKDVTDHHNALFDFFPDSIKLRQEFFVLRPINLFCNWLQ